MMNKILALTCPPVLILLMRKIQDLVGKKIAAGKLRDTRRLHLACGSNVISGWSNVDFKDAVGVVGVDLTTGIPVASDSVELVFCEHFIEHVPLAVGGRFLAECHRLLKSGGTLRISTPDLKKLLEVYSAGNIAEWNDVGWKPATPCAMINEGFRSWGHAFLYDEDQLIDALKKAGFGNMKRVGWRESAVPGLSNLECRPFHGDLIVEATKGA